MGVVNRKISKKKGKKKRNNVSIPTLIKTCCCCCWDRLSQDYSEAHQSTVHPLVCIEQ